MTSQDLARVETASSVCPACGSTASAVVDTQPDYRFFPDETFHISRCGTCQLLYTTPRLGLAELGKYYPASYPEYGDNVEQLTADPAAWALRSDPRKTFYAKNLYSEIHGRGIRRAVASVLNAALRTVGLLMGIVSSEQLPTRGTPGRCLHIGSGNGGRFLRLIRQGWKVTVVDVNAELMARWRNSPLALETFGAGIQAAEIPPGSCDVVFMTHVIEHFTDPVADLRKVSEWLAPGGTLVCELPMYGTLGWSLRPKYTYYDVPRHTMHFTARTLSALLGRAGLRVTRSIQTPDGWSFYYGDFRRFRLTGRPADCSDPNTSHLPLRHRLLGWLAWALRSSGNVCVYAIKD